MGDGLRLFDVLGLGAWRRIRRQTLLRRRRWFIHGGLNFVGNFLRSFLEFLDALAESLSEFGEFLRSEEDQDEREDENNLTATQVKQAEHGIHT